jgi:hypothetical protein
MDDIQEKIVSYLVDPYVADRAIDPRQLARKLEKSCPGVGLDELTQTVSRVATGIGVRIKESSGV